MNRPDGETNTEGRPKSTPGGARNTTSKTLTVLPHDLAAEEALLGAALLSASALEVLATKVVPADFYKPAHRTVAKALIDAFEQGYPADIVTINDTITRNGELESIGGPETLLAIQMATPSTGNAARYAAIVHDQATLRRVIEASQKASALALTKPFDVHATVEAAQTYMAEVAAQNGARSYSSLEIPDMSSIVAGDVIQEQPSILTRADGQALFYSGKMHVLQAEPSSGKSWLALYAGLEVLNMGGSVVYIDYEDSGSGIVNRLKALGADPTSIADRFQYIRPSGPMGTSERAELLAVLRKMNPDLIVIDGVAEAISRDGFDEDRNSEVVKWVDQYPRWITQISGASVVMIDHIAKDKDKGGRYARGAGHKLAAVDGASYQIKVLHAFSRHHGGSVKLVVAKDRPGVFSVGETAAIVHIEPSGDGAVVRMSVVKAVEPRPSDHWKPTKIMEKMSIELERTKAPLTSRLLLDMISASTKRSIASDALARLQAENFVTTYKVGNSSYLRLIKRYREGDEPLEPEVSQPSLAEDWQHHEDELAKRRAQRERDHYDDGDPGPTEPTD
jgi:hypothetical protein